MEFHNGSVPSSGCKVASFTVTMTMKLLVFTATTRMRLQEVKVNMDPGRGDGFRQVKIQSSPFLLIFSHNS